MHRVLYARSWSLLLSLSDLEQVLWESIPDKFHLYLLQILQGFRFSRFLLIEGYEQGTVQKELIVAPFIERFKTATLRKSSW